MQKILYIRTDANAVLGIGHVMRCRPIAEEWERRGGKSIFLVADTDSCEIVRKQGFEAVILDGAWDDLEQEIVTICNFLKARPGRTVLLDSYYVTQHYLDEIRKVSTVGYLGKFHGQLFSVDYQIDYTITAENAGNSAVGKNSNMKQLLGCRYFPLRIEFRGKHASMRDIVQDILITTGGSDPYHVAYEVSRRFTACRNDVKLHVILGKFNSDKIVLYQLAEQNHNICLYENVSNMAEIMEKCDLAVSAGGITLYELCACGVPTLAYVFADNQVAAVEEFARRGILRSVGDIREQADQWGQKIEEEILCLCKETELRQKMQQKMHLFIDGDGARRIVDFLNE